MFHLFRNHSSASNSDQAISRDDDASTEKVALSTERPATYDEMLPWLVLGAVAGF
jgi:hypothetical protein